jgi:hypothetical protein
VIILLIALSVGAAFVAQGSPVGGVAVANAVGSFWGNGVMAHFRADPHNMPGYAVTLSMITAVLAIVFLIVGLAT